MKAMTMYDNNILKDIENAEEICIAGHINPDGDAVGSVLALALYLKRLGKTPRVLLESIPARFAFFGGTQLWYNGAYDGLVPDVFFAVDCGDKARLGNAGEVFDRAGLTYCIDHHRTNTGFADVNIINANASSASEIVFELMKKNGFDPEKDSEIAADIYSGIVFDTGGFRHNCTGRRTHEIAGMLVDGGVDTSVIHSRVLFEHTYPQAKLFGIALGNMKHLDGVTYTTLTTAEIEGCGCTSEDLDGIVDYLLNLDISECAVLVTQRSETAAKASVRSKKIPIADIVVSLGGGGHALAAGVTCDGSAAEVAEKIVALIVKEIKHG
ncbi:MAG: DHH family phosphoesterase [Firmicutes bacterium]|nr:DHH family phosphoesterase [Bacillota bacterium]